MKFRKGISGNPLGRPRTKNMELRELINADAVRAYKLLWKSIQENQPWALELYFELLLKTKGISYKAVENTLN
mgnify:CR=1 FL=1